MSLMMRRFPPSLPAVLLLLAGVVTLAWWWPNRPRAGGVPMPALRLNSVSFAPFRPGQSPFTDRFETPAQVGQDLALLAPHVRAIRTYAALGGTADIAGQAKRYGLKLWQGIWLGEDRAQNAREIAAAIAIAHRYPHTVDRLIVGNEVLLRRDLPVQELIADIDQVRAAVAQPVTYADVWEFWQQFPQVAAHVDMVTIHLLPYWEDVPTGIDGAVQQVDRAYRSIATLFPGKRIVIGETGWPSRGRERRDAVPGRVNEVVFLRRFVTLARARGFDYNLIEAFDQDWKYASEGTVGANWGLWTADRTAKFPLLGPVSENPDWAQDAALSVLVGLVLLAAVWGVAFPWWPVWTAAAPVSGSHLSSTHPSGTHPSGTHLSGSHLSSAHLSWPGPSAPVEACAVPTRPDRSDADGRVKPGHDVMRARRSAFSALLSNANLWLSVWVRAWPWHDGSSNAARSGSIDGVTPIQPAAAQVTLAVLAMALGWAFVWAWTGTVPVAYDGYLGLCAVVNLAAQGALALLLLDRVGQVLGGMRLPPARPGAATSDLVRDLLRGRLSRLTRLDRSACFNHLDFLFAWTAMVMQLLLLFDPRYRDFPLPVFVVPLLASATRLFLGDIPRDGGREEGWVGGTLAVAAIASAVQEGPLNHQSLLWNAAALVLSAPLLLSLRRPLHAALVA